MREILFEAKTTDGQWVQGLPTTIIESEFSNFTTMLVHDTTGYWGIKSIIPETLAQYIGHTTEEGVRIFQNNILVDPYEKIYYVTEWDNSKAAFILREIVTDRIVRIENMLDICDQTFVPDFVGRVYDNPEFLVPASRGGRA